MEQSDFALIVISFRVAYTLGQAGAGRLLDAVGTRTGLTRDRRLVLDCRDADVAGERACGRSAVFRFLLGAGEAGNWPGATKAVAEWFPRRESGWAVALFDSGSSIGAAIAPFWSSAFSTPSAAGGRRSSHRVARVSLASAVSMAVSPARDAPSPQ